MNIHFTDKKLKETLDQSTIFEIEVDSGMYGLKTAESDTDILKIYLEGSLNLTSITPNHHQLQYNDTDYQKWLKEHQDFNYEDIVIQSNLEMTDESSWLLEEIEKVKEQKHLYDTLLGWIDICKEHALLTEVSYLTKSFYKEDSDLMSCFSCAMSEWDI